MRKNLIGVALLAALAMPASAQLNPQQQNDRVQCLGERHTERRSQDFYEHLPKRRLCRNQEAELRQRQAVRQFLHRD